MVPSATATNRREAAFAKYASGRAEAQLLVPVLESSAALPSTGLHHSDVSGITILAQVNRFRGYCIPSCIIYCGCHVRASEDSQNEVLCH